MENIMKTEGVGRAFKTQGDDFWALVEKYVPDRKQLDHPEKKPDRIRIPVNRADSDDDRL